MEVNLNLETRRRAQAIMRGVYGVILLLGAAFLYYAFTSTPVQPRIAVQAVIFMALGSGGLYMSRR